MNNIAWVIAAIPPIRSVLLLMILLLLVVGGLALRVAATYWLDWTSENPKTLQLGVQQYVKTILSKYVFLYICVVAVRGIRRE